MEVTQHTSEEMEIKIPLINHYKEEEEEEEEAMDDSLVGRRARRPSNEVNGHAIDENCENSDKSEVEESVNEDGAENGHMSNTKNVYFDNNEGASSPGKKFKHEDFGSSLDADIQKVISAVINGKTEEILSDSSLPRQEDDTNASEQTRNTIENLQVDIVDEIDEEVIELEFERAIEKMHTHDYEMYCPNCSNRITKVILRRRKITTKIPPSSDAQPPKKPMDLFGCLSCFSIFINAGNKLNPFRIFGRGKELESSPILQHQISNEPPSYDAISNVPQLHQILNEPPSSDAISNVPQQHQILNEPSSSDAISNVPQQHTSVVTSSVTTTTSSTQIQGKAFNMFSIFGKRRVDGKDLYTQPSPTSDQGTANNVAAAAAVAIAGNHHNKSPLESPALNGRVNIDNGFNNTEKQNVKPVSEIEEELNITPQQHQGKPRMGSTANKVAAAVAIAGRNHIQSSSLKGSELDRDVIIDINKNQDDSIGLVKHPASVGREITAIQQQGGGDVQVVFEEESIQRETSQFTTSTTVITIPGIVTEVQKSRSLEILKAIVYGGLIESIASLSIVSSAAASGTSTMKIFALGLAYLISGLVVIGHNLRDLRHDQLSESNEAENRYKELLGRRENYLLHAVVVVLSYLVFGIVPPLTYAFTFRESDDRDYKLLAVSAVSLLCIIILAISQAYTRGQHKFSVYFKAVVYYVSCAVMVGGIAFAVGDLGNKLMERLGWWDSSPVQSIWIPETKSINSGLASY